MMEFNERIKMYKSKKAFVEEINKVFKTRPKGSTVESVRYEVWAKQGEYGKTYFRELAIITFDGGAISVRNISGNSNLVNFRVIGTMVEGGYYDEVFDYENMAHFGFRPISLESANKLEELLKTPLAHITDVLECFECCKDEFDVAKVIRAIPSGFGTFYADFNEDETGFTITNEYTDVDESFLSETYDFDFYTGGLN